MLNDAALFVLHVKSLLNITQFGSYYVCLPFVFLLKDLGKLVDTDLKFHVHIISIVGNVCKITKLDFLPF